MMPPPHNLIIVILNNMLRQYLDDMIFICRIEQTSSLISVTVLITGFSIGVINYRMKCGIRLDRVYGGEI